MTATEYTLYCDESDSEGTYFSHFYGGVLIATRDVQRVSEQLDALKADLGFHGEVKWSKVTAQYLPRYQALVNAFFDLIESGTVKMRVMFIHNRFVRPLSRYQRDNDYFLLYHEFIQYAFGLEHCNPPPAESAIRVRLYLDWLPDEKVKADVFKSRIVGLNTKPTFRRARVRIDREQIAEVDSKKHVLLQCLDVVLGAMQFRLNDKHLEKPPGQTQRGKRTIAKEKLYKHIRRHICRVSGCSQFNVGDTTSPKTPGSDHWRQPYRHWCFTPRRHRIDHTKRKPRRPRSGNPTRRGRK